MDSFARSQEFVYELLIVVTSYEMFLMFRAKFVLCVNDIWLVKICLLNRKCLNLSLFQCNHTNTSIIFNLP